MTFAHNDNFNKYKIQQYKPSFPLYIKISNFNHSNPRFCPTGSTFYIKQSSDKIHLKIKFFDKQDQTVKFSYINSNNFYVIELDFILIS